MDGMEGLEFQEHKIVISRQANILCGRKYKGFSACNTVFNYSQVSINNSYWSFPTPSLYHWNHSHQNFPNFFSVSKLLYSWGPLPPVINPLKFLMCLFAFIFSCLFHDLLMAGVTFKTSLMRLSLLSRL